MNDNVKTRFEDGVAHLTLEMAGGANKINEAFCDGLAQSIDWALALDGLEGIVLGTGHRDFCVGADIDRMFVERDPAVMMEGVMSMHALLRKLETCGKPVVAALTGSALGGGYEIALACHRRIALDKGSVMVGLPETGLGLIPGGGGTQRLSRLVGLQGALQHIVAGKIVRAPKAVAAGLIDELAADHEAVTAAAVAWIKANPDHKQPWDRKGWAWPSPTPGTRDARNLFLASCAMLRKKTAGAFLAPEAAISAIHEGAAISFDASLQVEARHFVRLSVGDQAKSMIRTLWYHKNAVDKQEGLPHTKDAGIEKVGVIGAGMMGAGLAFVAAKAGYSVVLKDIDEGALQRGVDHCEAEAAKMKWLDDEAKKAILDRIRGTIEAGPLEGSDLIIEAVLEDIDVKHAVTKELQGHLSARGIWASNTSAIPITDLAQAALHKERFIGAHFFSPVEKMPLLEVIRGADTDDDTVARLLAFARSIHKTTVVVNDGYGFYTSAVFAAYISEAAQLVAEGHEPALVEWAAQMSGMAVAPLQVIDEVSLSLIAHGGKTAKRYVDTDRLPGVALMRRMLDEHDRAGKAKGAGFYDYADGKRRGFWSGLRDLAPDAPEETGVTYVSDRLMLIQAVTAARRLEEGVLRTKRDAEVAAILGVGFAASEGGPLSYLDRRGLREAVQRLDTFTESIGPRYAVPDSLRAMAERNERFFAADEVPSE